MVAATAARPSIFVPPEGTSGATSQHAHCRFALQPNIRFHMYISQAPCRPSLRALVNQLAHIFGHQVAMLQFSRLPRLQPCKNANSRSCFSTSRRRYADRALKRCKFTSGSDTTTDASADVNRTGAKPVDLNAGDPVVHSIYFLRAVSDNGTADSRLRLSYSG
jgi:hypothetical protein